MKGMLTVADILSQSEMKALNPAPRILPAVLEETQKQTMVFLNAYHITWNQNGFINRLVQELTWLTAAQFLSARQPWL